MKSLRPPNVQTLVPSKPQTTPGQKTEYLSWKSDRRVPVPLSVERVRRMYPEKGYIHTRREYRSSGGYVVWRIMVVEPSILKLYP